MATDNIDFSGEKGNLGDYRHASKLFVDQNLRLAPKTKFNFHVVFSFSNGMLSESLDNRRNEINMLVKNVDLPKFKVNTIVANQYNRKKVIQTKIEYDPVNINFHDDGDGVIRSFWEAYYGYYYADYTAAKSDTTYKRNATGNFSSITTTYGLDNGSKQPFLDYVTIYHMNHGYATSYKLINPMISMWTHDNLDYSNGSQVAEHKITLLYESVGYGDKFKISSDHPPGFGNEHYDTVPSSLTLGYTGPQTGILWDAINK